MPRLSSASINSNKPGIAVTLPSRCSIWRADFSAPSALDQHARRVVQALAEHRVDRRLVKLDAAPRHHHLPHRKRVRLRVDHQSVEIKQHRFYLHRDPGDPISTFSVPPVSP
jgi:hypothetical protein